MATEKLKIGAEIVLTMSYADKKLAGSIIKIRATRSMADLSKVYETEKAKIYDCGNASHIDQLWQAYHSHIGNV